jgi:ABC-2 type transport system permease protein
MSQRPGRARRAAAGLHVVFVIWRIHVKLYLASPFEGFLNIVWPLFFAAMAFLIDDATGNHVIMRYTLFGIAAMGVWSSVAVSGSSLLQHARWGGTLALETTAVFSFAATLIMARYLFGIPVRIDDPALFIVAVVLTMIAMGMFGFVLAVSAVRYRSAWVIGNVLEYPGWILCGFLVPLALLPAWAHPVSDVLAPTWGIEAMRAAAGGQSPWTGLLICGALAVAYVCAGVLIARAVVQSARVHATLALS